MPGIPMAIAAALLVAMAAAAGAQSVPAAKVDASLRRVFGRDLTVVAVRIDSATILRVAHGDTLLGWAQVRNVKGKDQPITYLVAVDPSGRLRDVDVLVYREPYGGEVAYEPWRRQIRGKNGDAPLVVGKDIRNISGATISVHAVTAGVRRALDEFAAWRIRQQLR